MHIVFLNQYYPPDAAPTGVMLRAVAEALVLRGHEVTVICAAEGYAPAASTPPESNPGNGVRVVRIGATRFGRGTFLGKLADYASYYAGAAWHLLRGRRADRIVALTTPPYLSVLARVFSRFRRADHAHWVMDLYPEVMSAHGMLKPASPWYRVLQALARWGMGGSRMAAVMTLGPDMAESTGRHLAGSFRPRLSWVPLWAGSDPEERTGAREAEVAALRSARGWSEEERVVMYSGNMGLGHGFGEILAAAEVLAAPDGEAAAGKFRFVFYGGGKRRREIGDFIAARPGWRVELHDYVSEAELDAHLRTADLHFVSLLPEWTGTMVPSKLQGIFTAGRPVLFVGDPECSIGRWVAESGAGWVIEPNGTRKLMEVLQGAAFDSDGLRDRGDAAAGFARCHFNREANVERIAAWFCRPA